MYAVHPPQGLGALSPLTTDEALALASLVGGLVGTLGLYFFATGRAREAYMIGIATGVTGAFVGAAKLLRGHPADDSTPLPPPMGTLLF